MKRRSCNNCYFADQCRSKRICGGYTPLEDELDDLEIENMIDDERKRYRTEYAEYVSQFDDDLIFW